MSKRELKMNKKRNRKNRRNSAYGNNRTREIQRQDAMVDVLLARINDPSTTLDELRRIDAQLQAIKRG